MSFSRFSAAMFAAFAVMAWNGGAAAQWAAGCQNENGTNGTVVSQYSVFVTDISICTAPDCSDGGASIVSSGGLIDIASTSAGSQAGALLGGDVPVGFYQAMRMSISRDITITAQGEPFGDAATLGGTPRYCVTSPALSNGGPAELYPNFAPVNGAPTGLGPTVFRVPESYATAIGNLGFDAQIIGDDLVLTVPISENIQEGYAFPSVDFSFGLLNTVLFDRSVENNANCHLGSGSPEVIVTFGGNPTTLAPAVNHCQLP